MGQVLDHHNSGYEYQGLKTRLKDFPVMTSKILFKIVELPKTLIIRYHIVEHKKLSGSPDHILRFCVPDAITTIQI